MNTFANMATMRVAKVKNKVLSDTMKLLSYTLVFGGLSSWFSTLMRLLLALESLKTRLLWFWLGPITSLLLVI
jgi:hypothetical protein